MKKTLVTALTTALVVGAASTTFAAANPFSDVPANHWAYDAVAQLADDGVIEGYGDGTYRGDRNITRFEMAQMVAKAMANEGLSASDRALVDRLAAEFADELNNLGVRVANLERNADKVKWTGKLEYTYKQDTYKNSGVETKVSDNQALYRLEPSAEVNKNWRVNARLEGSVDMDADSSTTIRLQRAWAQGDYDNYSVKFGKFASINDDNIFDTTFSGAEVSFGKAVDVTIGAGRLNNNVTGVNALFNDDANYQYVGLGYNTGAWNLGAAYHRVEGELTTTTANDTLNIWLVKANYKFDRNFGLKTFYAKSNVDDSKENKAFNVGLHYKGADQTDVGSWGAWVAYRKLGAGVAMAKTYDIVPYGYKGWEIGANYTPFENIVTTLAYGDSKDNTISDNKDKEIFAKVEFLF